MFNYQENKNLIITSLFAFVIFSILLKINIQNINYENINFTSYLSLSISKTSLIFSFVILPSFVFIFLQSILLRYVSFLWATSISALSIFSYAGYDFRQFIFDLFFNYNNFKSLQSKKIILLEYPNISFSIFVFLFITWLSLRFNRFKILHIIIITILWSMYSLLSFSGSIIGILFWSIYSSIRIYRLKKNILELTYILGFNIIYYFLFFYIFKNSISIDGYNVNNIYNFTFVYFLIYFICPLVIMFIIFYFYKIDFYEIIIKFTPIYVLMLSDFIISVYLANYKSGYQNHEYFIFPHFVLHFLYIVPIIYYLNKPLSPFILNKKTNVISIQKYIYVFFYKMSKFYLPILILSLLIFSILPGKL